MRIDLRQGRTADQVRQIADIAQDVMRDVLAAPPGHRYQIITEHPVGHTITEDTALGLDRTDGVSIVHIFQQGRTAEQKQAAHEHLARRVDQAGLIRPADLIVTVTTKTLDGWPFGLGRAHFVAGEL